MKYENIWIVLPAYNESRVIRDVVKNIQRAGYIHIVVVDDGSSDHTLTHVGDIPGVVTIQHRINRGKGAASKTGVEAAKILNADIIVTMDADGQHDPKDIDALIDPIRKHTCDISLGTRFLYQQKIPVHKKIYNLIGNIFTWYLYGLWVTDSQSGFRAYSKYAAHRINTKGDRYEYESEIIREIFHYKLRYCEVPIHALYTRYSQTKHMRQNFLHGCQTAYKMLWEVLR